MLTDILRKMKIKWCTLRLMALHYVVQMYITQTEEVKYQTSIKIDGNPKELNKNKNCVLIFRFHAFIFRSGEICPSTYVSYQSAERSKPSCSSIFPNSTNPVWDYVVETRLSTEYLYKLNKVSLT